MIERAEASRPAQKKYEIAAFSRLDYQWVAPHLPLWMLETWFHEIQLFIPFGDDFGGLYDRHAVMTRDCADSYFGGWRYLTAGGIYRVGSNSIKNLKV